MMASRPVMIMVAPNGARKTTADHPALPMTVEETVATAQACARVGASAVHAHVRDEQGRHCLDAGQYRRLIDTMARSPAPVNVQITTEAVGRFSAAEQMACVRQVRPPAVSLAVRELAPDDASEAAAGEFFAWLKRAAISAQFIVYDGDDVARLRRLKRRGVIAQRDPFVLFVLGRYADDQQSATGDLDEFLDAAGGSIRSWACCAFGRREAECALYAATRGGHVRIGFENNMHLPDGSLASDNAELVAATVDVLAGEGFLPMSIDQTRAYLAERAR